MQLREVLRMRRFTISIPVELKKRLDSHPEINWVEVVKAGFKRKLDNLTKFEELERRGEL